MTGALRILRAGPSTTIQDRGRFGMLRHGISESGPMDRAAFETTGAQLAQAGDAAIEFSRAGLEFVVEGTPVQAAFGGGDFALQLNGGVRGWPAILQLAPGDRVAITPGAAGNYGYLRFDRDIDVPAVLGSQATNLVAHLGGLVGAALRTNDRLEFRGTASAARPHLRATADASGPIRIIWGLHADLFAPSVREAFVTAPFVVSDRLDRMGVRLLDETGVFATPPSLSLVSDAVVAGDVQILGDGTPIVLMRDHQPTGGYPRIATIISADLDRLAQCRPGMALAFRPVTLQKARQLYLASLT